LLVEQGAEVVANDLALQPGSALVISGPNAGGKTVALKCMGLAAWMARSGLPITATPGSRVGWFDRVLTDVGDDQSVLRSLSTFSGHIKKLAAILEHADSGALVLLDEVASGTDPEEGSALAGAILAALTEKGAAVAVTTHYERLKELAAEHERFENASVGFDFAEMAPTFKLTLGIPGPSSALAVAARFGMPQAVLERARSLLSKTAIEREQLVRRLQERELLIDEIHRQAEADVRHQTQVLEQMRSEQENAQERERVRMASEARQLMDSVRTARARLRQVEQRLRQESSSSTLREAEREIDRAAHEVALGSPLASAVSRKAPASTSLRGENLEPGMMVIWTKSGATGEVLQAPERGLVKIRAGALKIAVPVEELAPAKAHDVPRTQRAKPRVVRKPPPVPSEQKVLRSSDNTLDLRGLRVEEALDRVDAFVDRLMARGEPAGFVLHGHGTGALKSAVRQHLAANHFVRRAEPAASDDGGDAFTLLRLVE
jgi:DNA mismatch repair protein MutS2